MLETKSYPANNQIAKPVLLLIALLYGGVAAAQQKPISQLPMRDLWREGALTGRAPETVKWSPDGTKISYVLRDESGEKGELWYIDTATGKRAVLVNAERMSGLVPPTSAYKNPREQERRSRYGVAGYHWAPDSKHLLFDSKGQFWYYRLDNNTAIQLTSSSDPQQDPKFSPDGRYLAYIRKHQLFVHRLENNREKQLTTAKATAPKEDFAGKDIKQIDRNMDEDILNGEVDWVYGEELAVRSNYFWSPDGARIAFLQMDETRVPKYPIVDWIPKHPTVDEQRYPKAGDPNPEVRVGVVGRDGGDVHWVSLSPELAKNHDFYIPRFGWVNDHTLYVMVLNRAQNQLDIYFADSRSGQSRVVLSDKSDTWIDIEPLSFYMFKSGDRFLISSWRDGHTHLYLYSFDKKDPLSADAKLVRQVTSGDFEVQSIAAVDEANEIVYYDSNEATPQVPDQFDAWRDRAVVARTFDGKKLWSIGGGTNSASFAPDEKHFTVTHSAFSTTPQMSLCTAAAVEHTCSDPFYKAPSLAYQVVQPKWLKLTADDGTPLEAMLLLPNVPAGRKAPVLLNPYGGPGGQVVRDSWGASSAMFDQMLVNDGIAVLKVDNRGMGARGKKFAAALWKNFGETELKDQLAALDQTLQQFPQLDGTRIGWWGWSYGGYMTLYAMTHTDRIAAGFAVAPVANWEDYDTIYTERYMQRPQDNADGYKRSSPVNFAAKLHGALVEAHGTSDDNVHMQNSIQMIQAYIDAGKQYSLLLYPRKTHGISGEDQRTQLFNRIRQHFRRYLLGENDAEQ